MTLETFGRYTIKALLGKTGMSSVYSAHDPNFNRDVAIKLLPTTMINDETSRARFEREAQTIAMLENPAIVPVYDFGEVDGQPYLVMRLMTGGSLSERIAQGPMELAEAARIMRMVASALDEAHNKGVIHRDLKPGNILFDDNNLPYLADFGIAKLSEAGTTLTGDVIIGTPAYMSPEQGRGGEDIDKRSDIYSLGVILFEMLTNQLPYTADSPMAQVIKHITAPIPNLLELRPDLPPEIQSVVNRVLGKRKITRYNTAGEFSQALDALLHIEHKVDVRNLPTMPDMHAPDHLPLPEMPMKGRPTPTPTRRRQPVESMQTIQERPIPRKRGNRFVWPFVILFVLIGSVVGVLFIFPAQTNQILESLGFSPAAPVAVQPSSTPTQAPPTRTSMPKPSATATEMPTKTPTEQVIATDTAPEATLAPVKTAYLPYRERNYPESSVEVNAINFPKLTKLYVNGTPAMYDIEWAPDGSVIAVGTTTGVYLYNPNNLDSPVAWLSAQDPVNTVRFSPDSSLLLAAETRRIVLWNWKAEEQVRVIDGGGKVIRYGNFSPDASLVSGGMQDTLIWNVSDGRLLFTLPGVPATGTSISPDSKLLGAAVGNQSVQVIRIEDGSIEADLRLFDVYSVVILPDGNNVIGIAPDTLHMYNLQSKAEIDSLGGVRPAIARNGKSLALDNQQGVLQVWAISQSGFGTYRLREYPLDKRYQASFQLSPNGSILAYWYTHDIQYRTTFTPSSIQFIDVIGDALLRNVKIQGEFVDNPQFFAEFSPDGKTLVSMANYRYLETMGVDTNAVDHNTLAHPISLGAGGYPFPSLQVNFGERSKDILSPDGSLRAFVSRSNSSVVSVVETKDNVLVSDIPANLVPETDLVFAPDNTTLATISTGGTIRIWNARSARQVCVIGGVGAVASITDADRLLFSSDGSQLAIVHTDGHLTYWSPTTCAPTQSFELSKRSYSFDHSLFVQIDSDGLVFRGFDTGAELGRIYGKFLDIAFSSDGRSVAGYMWDGTLHLWGVQP